MLVLELCVGGSLEKVLHQPHNAFGLEEEEFLLVFKQVGRFNVQV